MRTQHNRRLLRGSHRHHPNVPRPHPQRIRHEAYHLPRKALVPIGVHDTEGDALSRVRHHGPVAPVPAVGPAVQRIDAGRVRGRRVLVRQHVVRLAVDGERAVLDAVGVAARHGAEMGVLPVDAVVAGVVEAADDVQLGPGAVVQEEVADGRAVGDELGADPGVDEGVLAVLVGAGRECVRC